MRWTRQPSRLAVVYLAVQLVVANQQAARTDLLVLLLCCLFCPVPMGSHMWRFWLWLLPKSGPVAVAADVVVTTWFLCNLARPQRISLQIALNLMKLWFRFIAVARGNLWTIYLNGRAPCLSIYLIMTLGCDSATKVESQLNDITANPLSDTKLQINSQTQTQIEIQIQLQLADTDTDLVRVCMHIVYASALSWDSVAGCDMHIHRDIDTDIWLLRTHPHLTHKAFLDFACCCYSCCCGCCVLRAACCMWSSVWMLSALMDRGKTARGYTLLWAVICWVGVVASLSQRQAVNSCATTVTVLTVKSESAMR